MTLLPKALAILGPTASGKTRLALELSQYFPCEIISLDSALIYQGMDIGTAKPTQAERLSVPHHLIDIISPLEHYSAADFVQDCARLVTEIHSRSRLPIIVGGTMMYYHALTQGLNTLPEANPDIRAQLQQEKQQFGLTHLYQRLTQIDPITAARLDENDSQRIERALEVWMLTQQPLSQHFAEQTQHTLPFQLHTIALIPEPRATLHHHIAQRFEQMLQQGFIDEMHHLRQTYPDLHADLPSMRCVGYRQAWQYLEQEMDYADFVEQGIAATRQLAKRQLTWLRKITPDTVFNPYDDHLLCQKTQTILSRFLESKS